MSMIGGYDLANDVDEVGVVKGISLWQPWASAMAVGAKGNETRHWPTNHRGPTIIHAAKRRVATDLHYLNAFACWNGIFRRIGEMPFGALVAVGNLVDCVPTNSLTLGDIDNLRTHPDEPLYPWKERDMGDYSLGRFAWIFEDVKPLPKPVPFKGAQGFFNVPAYLIAAR
jgi:hypothetical protein